MVSFFNFVFYSSRVRQNKMVKRKQPEYEELILMLPIDIITDIILRDEISGRDLINITMVNKFFNELLRSERVTKMISKNYKRLSCFNSIETTLWWIRYQGPIFLTIYAEDIHQYDTWVIYYKNGNYGASAQFAVGSKYEEGVRYIQTRLGTKWMLIGESRIINLIKHKHVPGTKLVYNKETEDQCGENLHPGNYVLFGDVKSEIQFQEDNKMEVWMVFREEEGFLGRRIMGRILNAYVPTEDNDDLSLVEHLDETYKIHPLYMKEKEGEEIKTE